MVWSRQTLARARRPASAGGGGARPCLPTGCRPPPQLRVPPAGPGQLQQGRRWLGARLEAKRRPHRAPHPFLACGGGRRRRPPRPHVLAHRAPPVARLVAERAPPARPGGALGVPRRDLDAGVMPAPCSGARHQPVVRLAPSLWPAGPLALVTRLVHGSCSGRPRRVMRPRDPRARHAAWPPAGWRAASPAAGTACSTRRPPPVTQDEAPRSPRPPRHPYRGPRPVGPRETPWSLRPQRPHRRQPRSTAGPRWAAPPAAAAGLARWAAKRWWFGSNRAQLREPGGGASRTRRHCARGFCRRVLGRARPSSLPVWAAGRPSTRAPAEHGWGSLWCRRWPLGRGQRLAANALTPPTLPCHTAARSCPKPGRSWRPGPRRPQASAMMTTGPKPQARARSAQAYGRRWLAWWARTC
jgi:hypothetical protein